MEQQLFRNIIITNFHDTQQWKQYLKTLYETGNVKYIIAQLEECPKTKKDHIQGYIELTKRFRFKSLKKMLGETVHIENRKGTQKQAIEYCSKTETQKEPPIELGKKNKQGKRNDLQEIAQQLKQQTPIEIIAENYPTQYIMYYKGLNQLNNIYKQQDIENELSFRFQQIELYEWQEEIIQTLLKQNDRQILWVYDKNGNSGKSTLCKYIYTQFKAFYTSATKAQDITYQYNNEEIILFDFSRHNQEYINYGLIENFKNGLITSTKYETRNKLVLDLKILIFSNELPDMYKWTKDRYQIAVLNQHTIVYKNFNDYDNKSHTKFNNKDYDPLED